MSLDEDPIKMTPAEGQDAASPPEPPPSPIEATPLEASASAEPPPATPPVSETPADKNQGGKRGRSRRRRLSSFLTSPVLIFAMAASGLVLHGWNLLIRLPSDKTAMQIYARPMENMPIMGATRTPLKVEAIEALRETVREKRQYLIQGQAELVSLVAELERLALELGWVAQVSLGKAIPVTSDLPQAAIYPVTLNLSLTEPKNKKAPRPSPSDFQQTTYFKLLTLFSRIENLKKKMDISDLNLSAGQGGIQSVETTLHLWTDLSPSHAKAPTE